MKTLKQVGVTINSNLEQYIREVEYVSAGVTKSAFLQGAIEGTLYMSTPITLIVLTILFN